MDLLTLGDFERIASERVPAPTRAFIDGGAGDERVLQKNQRAFDAVTLMPRILVDVSSRSTSVTLLGEELSTPVMLAPSAMHRMVHPDGEAATVRGAGEAGALTVLSMASSLPVESVMKDASGPVWFQAYVGKDRALTAEVLARAEAAGCSAIVVTVDAPVVGGRTRELRMNFSVDPGWFSDDHTPMYGLTSPTASGRAATELWDSSLSWVDLSWIRSVSSLPIVLKGVLRVDDAERAAAEGIDAVIVSNHGGRQLDAAPATLTVLPPIADAVGDRMPVLVDGGIRRGTDVMIALAYGAAAVLVGRPILWGLSVDGDRGVEAILRILTDDLEIAMALCGASTVSDIDRTMVSPVRPWAS
jgi:4-hydroxymandelate oxidase